MKIRVLNPDEFDLLVREHAHVKDEELKLEGVADLIRSQALALGPTPRRVLVDTVERLLGPVAAPDRGLLLETVNRLEETGDLLVGERGRIGPAPLRAVRLTDLDFLILGALPTDDARATFGAEIEITGAVRRIVLGNSEVESFEAEVHALRGVVLSLDQWAGLDRHPPAGGNWLNYLNNRVSGDPNGRSADLSELQAYRPAVGQPIQGRRWKRLSGWPSEGLVRWRREGGWHEYAWVASKSGGKAVGLSKNEARRTMFSLDIQRNCEVLAHVSQADDRVVLEIDTVLPFAEYRALLGLMDRTNWREWPVRYEGDRQRGVKACEMLGERLGVVCSGGEVVFDDEA